MVSMIKGLMKGGYAGRFCVAGTFILFMSVTTNCGWDEAPELMALVDSSNLKGRLEDVFSIHRGDGFQLKGDPHTYLIYSRGNWSFSDFAVPGDSISKAPFHDTIFLFKVSKRYAIPFTRRF